MIGDERTTPTYNSEYRRAQGCAQWPPRLAAALRFAAMFGDTGIPENYGPRVHVLNERRGCRLQLQWRLIGGGERKARGSTPGSLARFAARGRVLHVIRGTHFCERLGVLASTSHPWLGILELEATNCTLPSAFEQKCHDLSS